MSVKVLLIHGGYIPHYRIPIYAYLSNCLRRVGIELIVSSNQIQQECPWPIEFKYIQTRLSTQNIIRIIKHEQIRVVIDFMELKHPYLFPTYLIAKGFLGCRIIYWGQGRDLFDPLNVVKNIAYSAEQLMCSALVLYAEHLKKYVPKRYHKKVFISNNTLCYKYENISLPVNKEATLKTFGIKTRKNIICMGRIQRRKRVDQLVLAFSLLNRFDIGLIFVGPDPDGILKNIDGDNIYKLGPIYGEKRLELLSSMDVCCIPGAVGLSIIDAFYCGLPFVTEDGDESAEIMYLKDGINGCIVPRGDHISLSKALALVLDDNNLRRRFSEAARREIRLRGNMDQFCSGFIKAIEYAMR